MCQIPSVHPAVILERGRVKKTQSDVLHSVWVTLLSVCSRLVGICEGVHVSVCVCALASSHVLLCVC